jgi:hypothetical protein
MRSELNDNEIEALLDDAERAAPDNEFVQSVRKWYEENDFITYKQEEALWKFVDRRR